MTGYIVLTKVQHEGHAEAWEANGPPVEAVSAEAAIRKAVNGENGSTLLGGSGTYVAVPVRSWVPVTVKVETQRKLTLA